MKRPALIILGSAASIPTPYRYTQSILILGLKDVVLVDCGEATQIRLQQTGVDLVRLNAIAITHIHGDHIFGLFPLLQSFALRVRSQNLRKSVRVLAPKALCSAIEAYAQAIATEVNQQLITCNPIDSASNKEFLVLDNASIALMPIRVRHGDTESYGYIVKLVRRPKRLESLYIFISGNGTCDDQCRRLLKSIGVDIIVHEATFTKFEELRARSTGHATCVDAAQLASELRSKLLILTHFSSRYNDKDLVDCLEQARTVFDGQIVMARDLMYVPLGTV